MCLNHVPNIKLKHLNILFIDVEFRSECGILLVSHIIYYHPTEGGHFQDCTFVVVGPTALRWPHDMAIRTEDTITHTHTQKTHAQSTALASCVHASPSQPPPRERALIIYVCIYISHIQNV